MHSIMEPNFFFSSPHYPYNIHSTSSLAMSHNWNSDPSYSTPVSTAFYNTTATASWAHTVPAFMPWVTESTATNTEQVVRFTAPFPPDPCTSQTATSWELFNNLGTSKTNANVHLKRRSDFEDSSISHKQYITEEKMAARLQELHISNQYTSPELVSESCGNIPKSSTNAAPSIRSLQELEALLQADSSDGLCKGSLILAPEIKNLVEPEKLFAQTIINQIERPTMAVVVWKPPQGSVSDIKSASQSSHGSTSDRMGGLQNNIDIISSSLKESNNNSTLAAPPDIIQNIPISIMQQSSSSPSFSSSEDKDYVMET